LMTATLGRPMVAHLVLKIWHNYLF
jgi:hypothetical protein